MSATIKQWINKAAMVTASVAVLAGFALTTHHAERRAEHALEAAIAAPGKLYAAPSSAPAQMATVVIMGKRS